MTGWALSQVTEYNHNNLIFEQKKNIRNIIKLIAKTVFMPNAEQEACYWDSAHLIPSCPI